MTGLTADLMMIIATTAELETEAMDLMMTIMTLPMKPALVINLEINRTMTATALTTTMMMTHRVSLARHFSPRSNRGRRLLVLFFSSFSVSANPLYPIFSSWF